MLPGVKITRLDGQTGVVRPSPIGNLAIIGSASLLPVEKPATFTQQASMIAAAGIGPAVEDAAYFFQSAQNPVLMIAPSTSVAGTITAEGQVKSGTTTATWSGEPEDEYSQILLTCTQGGEVSSGKCQLTVSFDGGVSTSGSIPVPNTGVLPLLVPVQSIASGVTVTFSIAASATMIAGDTFYASTTRPMPSDADLIGALEALRVTRLPWDNLLIDADATSQFVTTVDDWLEALEAVGSYHMAWINARHKLAPVPTTESEADYAAYLETEFAQVSSIRLDLGADAADLVSQVTGITHPRPTALFIATRAEKFDIEIDPAYTGNGPLDGNPTLFDSQLNPKWHDEELFPGIDDLTISTLRGFSGETGTFITNARLFSPEGSDYVWDQHGRVMNLACTIAFAVLRGQLSLGVRKQPPATPNGPVYILENDAQRIENLVNAQFRAQLTNPGRANAAQFILSRTDDLSSNSDTTVHGDVDVVALAYIKNFAITARFVKTIAVPPA